MYEHVPLNTFLKGQKSYQNIGKSTEANCKILNCRVELLNRQSSDQLAKFSNERSKSRLEMINNQLPTIADE